MKGGQTMLHEVNFQEWCPKCEHYKLKECEDPCHDCLNQPVNDDSRKPVMFKEGEKSSAKSAVAQKKTEKSYGRKLSVTGKPI